MSRALLDTDILSEVLKNRDAAVARAADDYLAKHGEFKVAHCVHPVQAYVDLKAHPERAPEAATEFRSRLLQWST